MAARPHGWPSRRRAVITETPDASEAIASWKSACGVVTPTAPAARRPRRRSRRAGPPAPGSGSGLVGALVGPAALLAREAGRGDQPRERERVARPAREAPRRCAAARRGATAPRASSGPGGVGQGRGVGRRRASVGRGSARDRQGRPAAEHEAFRQRVRRQPVGAVQARCTRTRPPRTGRGATPARPGRWPRRPSCSARPAPPGTVSRAGSMPTSLSASAMLGNRAEVHRAHVERHRARPALLAAWPGSPAPPRRAAPARRRTARPAWSSRVAPSPRTASVTRNPSRGPSQTRAVGGTGRTRGPRARRRPRAPAPAPRRSSRAGWWSATTAQRLRRWRARCPGRRSRSAFTFALGADARRSARRPRAGPRPCVSSSTSMRSWVAAIAASWRVIRRPVAAPPACTMRRAEWPPSKPSARAPWRSASKRTPRRLRAREPGQASPRTARARRSGAPPPRPAASVSRAWRSGESSTASAAAIPPCAQ